MRQAAVDDMLKLFNHFDIDIDIGQAVDVGGAPDVYMTAPTPNPLLDLHSNLVFWDGTQDTADRQVDFLDYAQIEDALDSFDRVFSFDTLEHCANPFTFGNNLIAITKPGGYVFVATVFAWHYHPNPEDYWRFSPAGLRACFEDASVTLRDDFEVLWSDWGSDSGNGVVLLGRRRNSGDSWEAVKRARETVEETLPE